MMHIVPSCCGGFVSKWWGNSCDEHCIPVTWLKKRLEDFGASMLVQWYCPPAWEKWLACRKDRFGDLSHVYTEGIILASSPSATKMLVKPIHTAIKPYTKPAGPPLHI